MAPWGILSPDQFLPSGPPALASEAYAADFAEVMLMGSATSPLRTADETDACFFWESGSPTHFWNRVALDLSALAGYELSDNAQLLATLNLAIADGVIACWNAKYTYEFWRPVTAIPLADTDGNANTIADPVWTPLFATPAHPEYVSGHSSASSAAAPSWPITSEMTPRSCSSLQRCRVGSVSFRAFPRRWTRSAMPAFLPAFTSEPPAKTAGPSAATLPATSWKIGCSASTEKVNSPVRLAGSSKIQHGQDCALTPTTSGR
jgi:hypothetical protein